MKELVEYVVTALVDYPDEVKVHVVEGNSMTILELTVAPSDMGRIIGKNGRVINGIRALIEVLAAKQGKRVTLDLLEND